LWRAGAAPYRRRIFASRQQVLELSAVVAVGLNLRPAVASVGPVLPAAISDLRLSSAFGGALTAIPTVLS